MAGAAAGEFVEDVTIGAGGNAATQVLIDADAQNISGATDYQLTGTASAGSLTWDGVCVPSSLC